MSRASAAALPHPDQHDAHFAPRVRDRFLAGAMSAPGVAVARGHLQNHLNALIDRPGGRRVVQNFATHLAIEFPAILTFLLEPDAIDATNWRAEHVLRQSSRITRSTTSL